MGRKAVVNANSINNQRILYIDIFSGISGDMFLASLIDLGASINELIDFLRAIGINVSIGSKKTKRRSISSTIITLSPESQRQRFFTISDMIDFLNNFKASGNWDKKDTRFCIKDPHLLDTIIDDAVSILTILKEAENSVHGNQDAAGDAHIHELGAMDTIIDIVGASFLLRQLNISRCYASNVPIGRGAVLTGHGHYPVPAPAVSYMLQGIPVYGIDADEELITPTGIAILRRFACSYGKFPEMRIERVGYGAGTKDIKDIPNVLRLWLGTTAACSENEVIEIITVIDDIMPEIMPFVIERLFDKGAIDAYFLQAMMKKGRAGLELRVIAPVGMEEAIIDTIFLETTAIGLRIRRCSRISLSRECISVDTPWGKVRAKSVWYKGDKRIYPEFEEAKRISTLKGVPLIEVYRYISSL